MSFNKFSKCPHSQEVLYLFLQLLLLLHQLVLLLSVLHLQLLVLVHYVCQGLHTPVVQLKPEHFLEAGILIEEHFINYPCSSSFEPFPFSTLGLQLANMGNVFSVNVGLSVGAVGVTGKGESLDLFVLSIKDNAFVDGL